MVQDHVRIGAERRKLFEEQISVKRVLPHAFRFKRHHTVDFLRAIGAYIVQQRHEVRCAALRWIGHALRFQHGIEHRGHPQPVVDKSRIHAVESALHHNGYRDDGQAVIEPLWMRKSGPTRNRRSPCIGFAGLAQSSFAIWARALSICLDVDAHDVQPLGRHEADFGNAEHLGDANDVLVTEVCTLYEAAARGDVRDALRFADALAARVLGVMERQLAHADMFKVRFKRSRKRKIPVRHTDDDVVGFRELAR